MTRRPTVPPRIPDAEEYRKILRARAVLFHGDTTLLTAWKLGWLQGTIKSAWTYFAEGDRAQALMMLAEARSIVEINDDEERGRVAPPPRPAPATTTDSPGATPGGSPTP